MKIGDVVLHRLSGVSGVVDATSSHPYGQILCRINDQWFFAADCE